MDHGTILRRSAATCAALLAAALAVPGSAQDGEEADSAAASDGPRSCLIHVAIRRTRILSDRNIVFVMRDNTIYNSTLPKACPTLRRRSLVNYAVANKRICAGDNFQVLWETQPGSYVPSFLCELGTFVPITEGELEDLTAMTEANPERRSRRRSTREAVTTEQVELPPATSAPTAGEPVLVE